MKGLSWKRDRLSLSLYCIYKMENYQGLKPYSFRLSGKTIRRMDYILANSKLRYRSDVLRHCVNYVYRQIQKDSLGI